jgi:ATP-dependent Clp protease protease subunit
MIHVEIDPRVRWNRDGTVVNKPIEIHVTHFHPQAVRQFQEDLDNACGTGQPVVPLLIDSWGGSVHGLITMLDHIDSVRQQIGIATVAQGRCMSAGLDLLSAGDDGLRFCSPTSTLMLHECASAAFGKNVEIQSSAVETERLNGLLLSRLDKNCGQSRGYFANLIHAKGHADIFMTPREAVRHRIVNHIGVPHLAMGVSVEYAFGLPKSPPKPHRHTKACKRAEKAAK